MDLGQALKIEALTQAAKYAAVEGKTEVEAYLEEQVENGLIGEGTADNITKALKLIFKEEMA